MYVFNQGAAVCNEGRFNPSLSVGPKVVGGLPGGGSCTRAAARQVCKWRMFEGAMLARVCARPASCQGGRWITKVSRGAAGWSVAALAVPGGGRGVARSLPLKAPLVVVYLSSLQGSPAT